MRLLLGLLLLSSASAQLPNSPSTVKALALNIGVDQRYSLSSSSFETTPRITLDYRVDHHIRVALSYGHGFIDKMGFAPGPPRPTQSNTLSVGLNLKMLEWGPKR